MASEKEIQAAFAHLADEIDGFVAVSLVDLDTGMTLGEHSLAADFDLVTASAFTSALVKQQRKTQRVIGGNGTLEDLMVITSDRIQVIRPVNDATFLFLVADRDSTNLAILRSALSRHTAKLA